MTENDILKLIADDEWMMGVLKHVRSLDLPDCWVGAGFVRNKVWDHLHGYAERTPLADVDVIYFNSSNIHEDEEKRLESVLSAADSTVPWSVKNQARMHLLSGMPPYTSTEHALAAWVETPTAIAVRMGASDGLELLAPHGITDLVSLIINPTPLSYNRPKVYEERIAAKQWQKQWPRLQINHIL